MARSSQDEITPNGVARSSSAIHGEPSGAACIHQGRLSACGLLNRPANAAGGAGRP